ncbi:hypothetical protein THTE_1193 [Thermogutta terrifontis]|uniref:Uncharacterized protein n=1 Tax=Thermogutta terrifontis TaxID=1331910 RepID=A0A286RCV1_9BACT|nr:hypothetical protein THTE_1193 [Thermogutta terrifontis]
METNPLIPPRDPPDASPLFSADGDVDVHAGSRGSGIQPGGT